MFFKQNFFNSKGFSLLELLSAASIAAVLSVVGIKSYQGQVNKAKTAEAQESLSYIYSTQQVFYNNWNSYHENLLAVGTIPSGIYNYDVGFTDAGHVSGTGTDLGNYPSNAKNALSVKACSTFNGVCKGGCLSGIRSAVGSTYSGYFSGTVNCEVLSRTKVLSGGSKCAGCPDAKAQPIEFKAIAVETLKTLDVWSINEKQQILHEKDGT